LGLEFARYLAPEGWQIPRCTDFAAGTAADVWALGLILLEVLGAASTPHGECKTLQHLSSKVLPKRGQQPVPRLRSDGEYGKLPDAAQRKLQACLSASPEERPSAEDILSCLAFPTEIDYDSPSHNVVSKEASTQHDLQELRVFSDASTSPSCTPSNAEESSFSSSSSRVNAPQPNHDNSSQEHCLEDGTFARCVNARSESGHAHRPESDGDGDVSCESRCANEFYSGVIEVTSRELSRKSGESLFQDDNLGAEIPAEITPDRSALRCSLAEELHSGSSMEVLVPLERSPSSCSMNSDHARSEQTSSSRLDLQGTQDAASVETAAFKRELLSASSDNLWPACIRTPRDQPPPPPEPTFEEMLLALPTPLRNRPRAEATAEKRVISKKVPPPPPAAAPPLMW